MRQWGVKGGLSVRYLVIHQMRQVDRDERLVSRERDARRSARQQSRIFSGRQREHAEAMVTKLLRGWKSTPFEHEAACRHGIRSALCLAGHGWEAADREAAALVSEGLDTMRARRPTWEQGQREYVIPRENCSWCERPVPDELLFGAHRMRFCSEVCARSAQQHRSRERNASYDANYLAAQATIARLRNPAKACRQCGTRFRPRLVKNEFCSHACGVNYRTRPDRSCDQCGKMFRPKTDATRFCSAACTGAARTTSVERACEVCGASFKAIPSKIEAGKDRFCSPKCSAKWRVAAVTYQRDCAFCGTSFRASSSRAKYCSAACTQADHKLADGILPKRLKPHVFDRYFGLQRVA